MGRIDRSQVLLSSSEDARSIKITARFGHFAVQRIAVIASASLVLPEILAHLRLQPEFNASGPAMALVCRQG